MTATEPRVDWDAAFEEALGILQEYLRIDTSNPPGRERLACTFLGEILEREGIDYELFDPGDDRVSLRAVLSGDGSKQPLMLLNHTDVVPVEREYWDEEPFAGLIQNGEIWGRGTLDMKGLGVAELLTVLLLKRSGLPLARDIVFLAVADEEAGGMLGIEWLERLHPEALVAEYVINEGGGGSTELFGVKRPVFTITTGEKGRSGCGWWRKDGRGTARFPTTTTPSTGWCAPSGGCRSGSGSRSSRRRWRNTSSGWSGPASTVGGPRSKNCGRRRQTTCAYARC